MQANGGTVLRVDSPAPGNSDVLVRSGPDSVSLTVEAPDPNANLVLNPKGNGTVVVPTLPSSDNSTNAASTAFVKAALAAASSGVISFDGRAGAVTLAASDVTGVLGFQPYSAANPAGYIAAAGAPVQSVAGRIGAITLGVADVSGAAPAASPTFTGATKLAAQTDSGFRITGNPPGGTGTAASGTYLLIGNTSATVATRLTVDGNAPGSANCINPAANTALDLFIEVVGIDTTAAGNVSRYRLLDVLLYRGASSAATQVVNGASGAPPNGSIGSGGAAAYTVAADTTNGCLALSVAAPNTDTWHWAARVRSTEVQ
jgi:hypothetical protein